MSMDSQPAPNPNPMWMVVLGWILTLLCGGFLVFAGTMKLAGGEDVETGFKSMGLNPGSARFIGTLEVASALFFLLPRTAVMGAVLCTGFMGGAILTHVRLGDPFLFQVVFGVFIWLALYLRDARIRALLPARRSATAPPPPRPGCLGLLGRAILLFIVIVGIFIGLVAVQPDDLKIERSITINAPPAKVFAHVNDFNKWKDWSPWEKLDPAMEKTIEPPAGTGAGASYKWSGNNEAGEGMMTIIESRASDKIKIKLDFIRPFEASYNADFAFKPQGKQTVVTWTMTGQNNYLSKGFGMFINMDKAIGKDFEKGLATMKELVEPKK